MTRPALSEIWRTIPTAPAYSVSSRGRIRRDALIYGSGGSVRRPQGFLKPRSLPLGHLQITLSMGGKRMDRLVHRLVAEAFLPPPMPGQDCVLHSDDDPSNNAPSNLRWGTRADNANDRMKRGRHAVGERAGGAKLTPEDIETIRGLISQGLRQRDVAARVGISQANVSSIVNGKTWGHL